MKRVTVDRYWRMESLDEERGAVMDGMIRLIHAYEYLKNDGSSSEETLTAMRLIMPIIGTLEDRNKGMAEESGDLWDAILDLDGAELSSAEIERERAVSAGAKIPIVPVEFSPPPDVVHRSLLRMEEVPRLVKGERRARAKRTATARDEHPNDQQADRLGSQDDSKVYASGGGSAGVRAAFTAAK